MTYKKRFYLIDGIRGLTVISMAAYHFLFDYFVAFGNAPRWFERPEIYFWQQSICWSFILISGFVWTWGRKANGKRGLILNGLGFGITLVTYFLTPGLTIWFGILNFLGCAVLLMYIFERPARKLHPALGLVICFALFIFCRNINSGYVGLGELWKIKLPMDIYTAKVFTPLGFPFPGFVSGDYFPILPWMLLYLCGYFLGRIFERHREWYSAAGTKIPVLSYIGSKSLWIYILHQPLNMLLCSLILKQPLF